MGVWIETFASIASENTKDVTPHVGVWIETHVSEKNATYNLVTPHVGVWIETPHAFVDVINKCCHSPRGSVD